MVIGFGETFDIAGWNSSLEIVGEEAPVRPQESVIELGNRNANQKMNKREKENCLSEYQNVIDFVYEVISNVYGVNDDENHRYNLGNNRKTGFAIVIMGFT